MLVGDEHAHLPRLLDLRPLRHLGLRHLPVRPSLQRAGPIRSGGGLMRAAALALAIGLGVLGAGIARGAYLHVGCLSAYDQRQANVKAQAASAVAARPFPAAKDAQAAFAV